MCCQQRALSPACGGSARNRCPPAQLHGALAAAWLTSLSGHMTGLFGIEFRVYTRLRLGKALLPRLSDDGDCPCKCSEEAGTRSLVCASLWGTVAARHTLLVETWRRVMRHHLSGGAEPEQAPQGPRPRPPVPLGGSSHDTLYHFPTRQSLGRARNPSWRHGLAPPLPCPPPPRSPATLTPPCLVRLCSVPPCSTHGSLRSPPLCDTTADPQPPSCAAAQLKPPAFHASAAPANFLGAQARSPTTYAAAVASSGDVEMANDPPAAPASASPDADTRDLRRAPAATRQPRNGQPQVGPVPGDSPAALLRSRKGAHTLSNMATYLRDSRARR